MNNALYTIPFFDRYIISGDNQIIDIISGNTMQPHSILDEETDTRQEWVSLESNNGIVFERLVSQVLKIKREILI